MNSLKRNIESVFTLLIILCGVCRIGFAQEHTQRSYSAARLEVQPPVIDGRLNDSAWFAGFWEEDFIQRQPYEGQPASQHTAYKVLYDNDNIYVAIKAYDSNPEQIEKRLSRRDDFQGDWVAIAFDSYFDKLTAFSFGVSAAGVKNDIIVTNDDQMDDTWNPVWYVKTSTDEEGWKAEMKIPLTQIRFAREEERVWGLQVMRWLFRNEEFSIWQPISQETSSWVSRFGELHGINGIRPKKEVELIPYVMGRMEKFEEEEGNPFTNSNDFGFNAGLDGKIAVTNDLTLNFTINPDFGQVEADPSEVNLTAFETFFQEKRPFFIEGSNIYKFNLTGGDDPISLDNLFYSRRIGRPPNHEPEIDSLEYMELNDFTRILGALKLSGKTQNGWSIGVMESLANKEIASIDSMGTLRDETIEPYANFFNTRVQKDFAKGNTVVGGMITSTNRKIDDESVNFLPREAYTGGLDFINFWRNKDYFLGVKSVFSQVSGSNTAIKELQECSRRYYQRPDADHLSLDTNRTSLSGYGGTIEGGKIGGNWRYAGFFTWRSPGLELNDMGYLREADLLQQALWAQFRVWEPSGIYRSYSVDFNENSTFDFSGTRLKLAGNISFNMEFKNYWSFVTMVEASTTAINRAELRGGPALAYPGDLNNHLSIRSDARKKLMAEFMMFNNWGGQGSSRFISTRFQFTYRPVNALSLSFAPSYTGGSREMHYNETVEIPDDSRYIMSELASDQLSADFRVNFNITPDLTLQYWGQPFLFSGDFSTFKRVTDPRASEYNSRFHVFTQDEIFYDPEKDVYEFDENQDGVIDYSIDNPNFNFSEFRSNFVLRWEYIPGSTLYVVWSQGRMGDDSFGEFNFRRDIEYLYSIAPHNVFQIKFSYRISL